MNLVQVFTAYPSVHGHVMPPTLVKVATVSMAHHIGLPGTGHIAYYLRQVFIKQEFYIHGLRIMETIIASFTRHHYALS